MQNPQTPGRDELKEVPGTARLQWELALKRAREDRRLQHEYDPLYGQDIGSDTWAGFAVKCAVEQPMGAGSSWLLPPANDPYHLYSMVPNNANVVREPDPERPHGIGKPVGFPSLEIWNVVRPHDCGAFIKYRPGLTPGEHIDRRERVPSGVRRAGRLAGAGLAALAALASIVGTIVAIAQAVS